MKLDVRGEICPYPQVKIVAALKKTGAERPTRGAHRSSSDTRDGASAGGSARLCRRDRGSRHRGMLHCAAQRLRRKALLMAKSSNVGGP
jgi:hypothetical protein